MNDEDNGVVDTLIDNEDIVLELDDDNGEEKTDREKKLEEIARNQKIRAEKAEKEVKEAKELLKTSSKPETKKEDLSTSDLYALMSAKVPQEDVEEVVKAAKLLGKTVQEALKDETLKTILERRDSFRKTADASNTKSTRPGAKTITDSDLLANASKGEFPAKGSPEAERLFFLRRGKK